MKPTRKPVNTIQKLRSGTPLVIGALGDSLTYGWMVDKGVRFDDLVPAERVHPVSQGYRIMAEAVMQLSS